MLFHPRPQALKFNIEFPLAFASKTVNEKETPYTDRDRYVCVITLLNRIGIVKFVVAN